MLDMLAHYRKGAVLLGREQWRLFFETGKFNKNHDADKITFAAVIGAANRVQMCRRQVVAQLQGWVSNCSNYFHTTISRSNLHPDTKHMLYVINQMGVWFLRNDVVMRETGEIIPVEIRKIAQSIMRHIMRRHRRPNLSHISMWLDHRAASISIPTKANQAGKVAWWVNLSTMENGQRIDVPLINYKHHKNRAGRVTNGLQVNYSRDAVLSFGIVTDMGETCAKMRADYDGAGVISLDFGLSTMFATSEGQLLGQGWLKRLRRYDDLMTMIAACQRRQGSKPSDSKRYRKLVVAMRGFVRTEVGRVMNRLVEQGKPKELMLERLDFRNPHLSKRLNRLIQNCGRSVIQIKLVDFEQRFGIKSIEVNPAYTSQTCSNPSCGYVDKRNRRSQDTFQCLWCGHKLHADLNAAQSIKQRRALPIGSVFQSKAVVLAELVRQFRERHTGSRDAPADPRLTNPYFNKALEVKVRLSRRRKTPVKLVVSLALKAT